MYFQKLINHCVFPVFRDVQTGRWLSRAGLLPVGDVLPAVHRVRRAGPQRHLQLDQRLLQSRVRSECVLRVYTSSPTKRNIIGKKAMLRNRRLNSYIVPPAEFNRSHGGNTRLSSKCQLLHMLLGEVPNLPDKRMKITSSKDGVLKTSLECCTEFSTPKFLENMLSNKRVFTWNIFCNIRDTELSWYVLK